MSKAIALLGATGFIGQEVLSYLQNKDETIYACSKTGGEIGGISVDSVDLMAYQELIGWLEWRDIDTVMYLSSVIPNSFQDLNWSLLDQNLAMHKNILELWKDNAFHLIYASGCTVYGKDSPQPWKESNITMPENLYTISKLFGEVLLYKEYQNGLPLTILRINAPYGVYNRRKTVVNIFIEQALKGENIFLHGTGEREQDFIYVKDVARAFLLAYMQKKSGIYNIASGNSISMRDLAKKIVDLSVSDSKIKYSGAVDNQEGQKVSIDTSKAYNSLGFRPKYPLEEGLTECIEEYRRVINDGWA